MFGKKFYYWSHTHGLKFGTQLLKFGIRKKNIVIVVYHKLKN
jgi:hypothetical protein